MNYLVWYKEILNIPIKNKTKVNEIKSINKNNFQLTITNPSAEQINIYAHKIVLATGIQGGGEWSVPSVVSESLPKSLYAHSSEIIDFNELDGKDIGILGGGASAFDTAKTALEKGANSAHVFIRRRELPKVNPIKKMSELGVWEHYYDLSDDDKYTIMKFFMENQPPTNESFQKASEFENFKFYTEESWDNVELQDNKIIVTTPKNKHQFDYLITATGTNNDLTLRPETLKNFEPYIAHWKDHFTPTEDISNEKIDSHPYLKSNFEFTSKDKKYESKLYGLFVFNYSSLISHGLSTSVLTGLRYGLNKITTEISKQLFFDNKERILNDVYKYDEIEFTGKLHQND
jgi:thioredoxin reductase